MPLSASGAYQNARHRGSSVEVIGRETSVVDGEGDEPPGEAGICSPRKKSAKQSMKMEQLDGLTASVRLGLLVPFLSPAPSWPGPPGP